jgi:nitrate reductase delta subunit
MVDLAELYRREGLRIASAELPDYLPLFLEFLSEIPASRAEGLIADVAHILDAIRLRLESRKAVYASVFSCIEELAGVKPQDTAVTPDDDPDDLSALDAAWEDEPVTFGPGAASSCKESLIARVRAARRPAAAAS